MINNLTDSRSGQNVATLKDTISISLRTTLWDSVTPVLTDEEGAETVPHRPEA